MKRALFLLALGAAPVLAQGITSSTCWPNGGRTCFLQRTWPYGEVECDCAAHCGNGNDISAGYVVWWSVPSPSIGSGQVRGGPESYAIKVTGRLMLYCNGGWVPYTTSGEGYDRQDCNGVPDYESYDIACE